MRTLHFILRKKRPNLSFRAETPSGTTVLIPGRGVMERSELKEHLASINEEHGTHLSEADVEEQDEARIKGTYKRKPSFKRKQRTGSF